MSTEKWARRAGFSLKALGGSSVHFPLFNCLFAQSELQNGQIMNTSSKAESHFSFFFDDREFSHFSKSIWRPRKGFLLLVA